MTLRVLLLLYLLVGSLLLRGQDSAHAAGKAVLPKGDYSGAMQALDSARWAEAEALLSSLVQSSPSAAAYYNLALSAQRQGKVGLAAWALASSEALGGVADDEGLRREIQAQLPPDQIAVDQRTLDRLTQAVTRLLGAPAVAALALLLTWLGVALWLWGGRWRGLAVLPALLAGLALLLAFRQNTLAHPAVAVVMRPTTLHEAPSAASPALKSLVAGATTTVGEKLSGFQQVVLPTGESGWIEQDALRLVDP